MAGSSPVNPRIHMVEDDRVCIFYIGGRCIYSDHIISMSEDDDFDDYYLHIPEAGGLGSVYVDIATCLPAPNSAACGCYHVIRYADGRVTMAGGDSICKMFLNRHRPVADHFKKYLNMVCVKRSASGVRYLSTTLF